MIRHHQGFSTATLLLPLSVIVGVACVFAGVALWRSSDRIDTLRAELSALEQSKQKLSEEMTALQGQLKKANDDLGQAGIGLSAASVRNKQLESERDGLLKTQAPVVIVDALHVET